MGKNLDPGSRIRIKVFLTKKLKDPVCSSRILALNFFSIPDPGIKKAPVPGSGSATYRMRSLLYNSTVSFYQ
jgi:hypothetical protein